MSHLTKKQQFIKEKEESTRYNREFAPSPVFSFDNSEIATDGEEILDFFEDKPKMGKYLPMTNLVVSNNSAVRINIALNQDRTRVINLPAGVIRVLEKDEIQGGISSLIIINKSSTTVVAADTVNIEVFRVGEQISSTFQKVHRRIFSIGGF